MLFIYCLVMKNFFEKFRFEISKEELDFEINKYLSFSSGFCQVGLLYERIVRDKISDKLFENDKGFFVNENELNYYLGDNSCFKINQLKSGGICVNDFKRFAEFDGIIFDEENLKFYVTEIKSGTLKKTKTQVKKQFEFADKIFGNNFGGVVLLANPKELENSTNYSFFNQKFGEMFIFNDLKFPRAELEKLIFKNLYN